MVKDLYLFDRNLTFRFIFDKDRANLSLERDLAERTKHFSMEEFRALRDLMLLYEEGAVEDPHPSQSISSIAPHHISTSNQGLLLKPF